MDDKKTPKNPKNFYCVTCDFRSSNKKDYNRHLSTAKHLRMTQCLQIDDKKTPLHFTSECGKSYKYRQSLYRHKLKCKLLGISPQNKEKETQQTLKIFY